MAVDRMVGMGAVPAGVNDIYLMTKYTHVHTHTLYI